MVPKKGDEPAAAPPVWSVFRAAVDEIFSSRSGAWRGGLAFGTSEGGSFGAARLIEDGDEQLGIRVRHGGSAVLAPRERAGNDDNPIAMASTELLVASGFSLGRCSTFFST